MATATEAPASITAEGPTSHTQNQTTPLNQNTFGYTREEQIAALHKLREPFKAEEIRYLPRMWCGQCKNSQGKGCNSHPRKKCQKCGQNMPGGHIDLRFVGHAEATNRLLNVDPFWDWEPLTVDERGLPQVDGYRGLWIRMTVCGMTRLGYGHAGDKTGGDAVKEVIGDAIRNAGIRFGMALDLWTSSDLEIVESGVAESEDEAKSSPQSDRQESRAAGKPAQQDASGPSEHLARLMSQVTDCWNSDNVLIFEQIKSDGDKHKVLDEEFTRKDGVRTTLRKVLDDRIAELKAAQAGEHQRSAA